jgi:hypothetical protein
MTTARRTALAASRRGRRGRLLDPHQAEHELAEAIITLLIAVSRYGTNDRRARPTAKRLATIEHIAMLVVGEIAEHIDNINGKTAARRFKARIGK